MKNFSFWNLCLAVMLGTGYLSCAQSQSDISLKEDEQLIEFTTDRFTLPSLHVTPDKKHIIFDVLGDIYQVPIEGGKAEIMLQDSNWKRGAKLSPDGKTLAYISDEAGEFQVWTYSFESREKKVYPITEVINSPLTCYWTTKGELIISDKSGFNLFSIDSSKQYKIDSNEDVEKSLQKIIEHKKTNFNNDILYYYKDGEFWSKAIDDNFKKSVGSPSKQGIINKFIVSKNENNIVYLLNDQNDYKKLFLISWDIRSDNFKILSHSYKNLSFPNIQQSFDFIDNRNIILDKEGEIVKMNIDTGEYEPIPIKVDVKKIIKKPLHREPQYIRDSIITASVLRNPVTHPDLDTIYFGAFGKLYTFSKTSGAIKEVFPNKDRFEISPSLSPNGKYLAYTTWNDWEMGHLYVRELSTGRDHQITQQPGRYINPAWSPDGKEIVFIADINETKMGYAHQTPGSVTKVFHLDVLFVKIDEDNVIKKGQTLNQLIRVTPLSIMPNRFYPIPKYKNRDIISLTTFSKDKNIPVFIEIEKLSKQIIKEFPIPFNLDEILLSPNNKKIAIIKDNAVWISDYPFLSQINKKYYLKDVYDIKGIDIEEIFQIYEVAPSYLSWQDENTLMWGSADEIYTYDVRTQETKKIANIRVQKERAIPKARYALTNARIITMNQKDKIIEEGTILVKDNRIEAVGESTEIKIPQDYKIFNLSGKTIIPGLIDVHAHYHHSPYEFTNQQEYQYIGNLAFGITTIYDPSVNVLDYREHAQMVEVGILLGPRVFASGNIIMNYPNNYGYVPVNNTEDAERILNSMKKLNVFGPLKEYDIINKTKRNLLHQASENNNFTITTHQMSLSQSLSRIISGYTSIEHLIGNSFINQSDVSNLIGKSKVNYTPTFYMVPSAIGYVFNDEINSQKSKLVRFNGDILFNNIYENDFSESDISFISLKNQKQHVMENELFAESENIKRIIENGGILSIGGHSNPFPGISTHFELWAFTWGGLSNYEALKSATINGAKKLDLQDELGSIRMGKLADLVVLNSNPIDNIYKTIDILFTIENGRIYLAENMQEIFPEKEKLKPWGWENPNNWMCE